MFMGSDDMERLEDIRRRHVTLDQLRKQAEELPNINVGTETGIAKMMLNQRIEQQKRIIEHNAIRDELHLLSLIDRYKKESELTRSYLVTIGNIARRQDNIHLQEINRHVDDILDSLEKEKIR